MKVAFFCDFNKNFNKKIENLEEGNIGIGGTQYLFMLIVSNLQKKYNSNKDEFMLLTNVELNINHEEIIYHKVEDIIEAYKWCEDNEFKYLVIRENEILKFSEKYLKNNKVSFVLWAHNYIGKDTENILYRENNVIKLICVSEQQYMNMKDSIAFKKMTYINNCIGKYVDNLQPERRKREDVIYYVGAIEPAKGVHNVIKIFSKICSKRKDLKLVIIGGLANLRQKNDLDHGKITYSKYEQKIAKVINKKKIGKNVEFLGVLDNKKIREIVEQKPGIALISVSKPLMGETFCMIALEMESYGIPVIARKRNDGLETSISNKKTGYLERTDNKIKKRIMELLEYDNKYYEMSKNGMEYAKNFSVSKTIDIWYNKLDNIGETEKYFKESLIYKIKRKIGYNFMTIKEIILRIQTKFLMKIYRRWMM